MHLYAITYILGNIEKTCVVMSDNRSNAQGKVAATEPDDAIITITCTEQVDEMVFLLNERRSIHVTN